MCFGIRNHDYLNKNKVTQEQSNNSSDSIPKDIQEHSERPFLNTNLKSGILGFRYENKTDGLTVIYSSVEAKTLCILMKISPLK